MIENTYFDIYNEYLSNLEGIEEDALSTLLEEENIIDKLIDAIYKYINQDMSIISLFSNEDDIYVDSELESEFHAMSTMVEFSYGVLALYEEGLILNNPTPLRDESGDGVFTWRIAIESIHDIDYIYNKILFSIENNKYSNEYKMYLKYTTENLEKLLDLFIEEIRYILSDEYNNDFPSSDLIKEICTNRTKFGELNTRFTVAWGTISYLLARTGQYEYIPYLLFSYKYFNEFWNDKKKYFHSLSSIFNKSSDIVDKMDNNLINIEQSEYQLRTENLSNINQSSSTIQNFLSSNTGLIITKVKENGLQLSAAALQNDENIARVAGVIHNLLPTAIRFFVSYHTVENFLLNNRQWLINKLT